MKEFKNMGFRTSVTNDKLKIEIPIRGLVFGFEQAPNNCDESKVKRGKRKEFAEFVAEQIIEECDSETGDTPLTQALDKVFDLLIEGYEDGSEFIKFGDKEE